MTLNDDSDGIEPAKTVKKPRGPKISPKDAAALEASAAAQRISAAESEWIELFPNGISVGSTIGRPVLILKDQAGAEVLPVWMHPLDAGVAVAELSQAGNGASPHLVSRKLMEALSLSLDSCVFIDLVGHHQFVHLTFRGETEHKTVRVRADEAMSFCLQSKARFYSTRPYMARCRDLDADLAKFENNLAQGLLPDLQEELEISSKKHPYVM